MKQLLTIFWIFCFQVLTWSQRQVAITIDDIPNRTYFKENVGTKMLETLDSLEIPICIFINEGKVMKQDSLLKQEILKQWLSRKYITPANHSYSHYHYSEVGFDIFTKDVLLGEKLTRKWAPQKKLNYFRFPFNDLGKDSLQQDSIRQFLRDHNYVIAPFTVESVDWMYNYIYDYYMAENDLLKAEEIGKAYVEKTLEFFQYIEQITDQRYGRKIRQIYMCHDNNLNARYLPEIISRLETRGYSFISMKKAMKDKVYKQPDFYYKKWGISWVYRWMQSPSERKELIQNEPLMEDIEKLYNFISSQK